MDLFEEIVKMRRAGQRGALATIVHTNGSIPSYESSRMLVREDGSLVGTIGGGCVEADVWAAAKEVMQKESPRKMVFNLNNEASYDNGLICGGTVEIFVEPILPQPIVYVFGAGHVSMAMAKAASAAGFAVGVVDDREAFANLQRFPMAQDVFTSYEQAFEKIQPNASTYLVIVTRGHKEDMRVLAWAVRTQARYVGMIGSKRKVLSVYKALEKEGFRPEEFERVYAPMGLEIGALSPEEIVINHDWEKGQLSSIQAAIRSLPAEAGLPPASGGRAKDGAGHGTDGLLLCLIDHPLISSALVNELIEQFYAARTKIVLPKYEGRRGHPVIFPAALYEELMRAPADKGARAVVWAHAADVLEVPTNEEGCVLNLNDPETLLRATGRAD